MLAGFDYIISGVCCWTLDCSEYTTVLLNTVAAVTLEEVHNEVINETFRAILKIHGFA